MGPWLFVALLLTAPASHGLEMPRISLRANPLPPMHNEQQNAENTRALVQRLNNILSETARFQILTGFPADDSTMVSIEDIIGELANLGQPTTHVLAGSTRSTKEMNESININMTLPIVLQAFGLADMLVPNFDDLERLVSDSTNFTDEWYLELFQLFVPNATSRNWRIPAVTPPPSAYESSGGNYVQRPDGRYVEYFVSGDPDGTPIVYYQGFLGSGLPNPVWAEIAEKLHVKLITPSMPGWGLSTPYPLGTVRNLMDTPDDVKAILDKEGITRAHFAGMSFGGPHAEAIALALPKEMVGNLYLDVPYTHIQGASKYTGTNFDGYTQQNHFQRLTRMILGIPYFNDLIGHDYIPEELLPIFAGDLPTERPEAWDGVLQTFVYSPKFTYRGIPDNGAVLTNGMGFLIGDLENIGQDRHVGIGYSPHDAVVPPSYVRILHEVIEGSVLLPLKQPYGHWNGVLPETAELFMKFLLNAASGESISATVLLLAGLVMVGQSLGN